MRAASGVGGDGDGEASVGGRASHSGAVVAACCADGAEVPRPRREGRHCRVAQGNNNDLSGHKLLARLLSAYKVCASSMVAPDIWRPGFS